MSKSKPADSVTRQLRIGITSLGVIILFVALSISMAYVYISASQSETLQEQASILNSVDKVAELSGLLKDLSTDLNGVSSAAELEKFIISNENSVALFELKSDIFIGKTSNAILNQGEKISLLLNDAKFTLGLAIKACAEVLELREKHHRLLGKVYGLKKQIQVSIENQLLENNLAFYAQGQGGNAVVNAGGDKKIIYENTQRLGEINQVIGELFFHFSSLEKTQQVEEISVIRNAVYLGLRSIAALATEVIDKDSNVDYARRLYQLIDQEYNLFASKAQLLQSGMRQAELLGKLVHLSDAISEVTRDYREAVIASHALNASKLQSRTTASFASLVLVLVLAFIVYAYFFRFLIYNRLILPILDITRRTLQLSGGDLSVALPYYQAVELNDMTNALNIFREKSQQLERANIELLRANQDIENFAYAASHDLKSPLRGIANLTSFLREDLVGKIDRESEQNIDEISRRVKRLENLLNDLLNYAVNKNLTEEPQSVCPLELFKDSFSMLDSDNRFKLHLHCEVSYLQLMVTPLKQVLHNLIDNAMKHNDSPIGNISIGVSEYQDRYLFYVEDDGPGISSKYHEKIFDMFQTLKPKDEVEGSGMGLALVAKLVNRANGEIWVSSKPHQARGCRFSFYWAKAKLASAPSASQIPSNTATLAKSDYAQAVKH